MDKFEYYTFVYALEGIGLNKLKEDKLDAELNELGAEGWELVNATAAMVDIVRWIIYTFKRKI